MANTGLLRIGIAGCGRAGRAHLARLLATGRVEVVGCADPDPGVGRVAGRPRARSPGPRPRRPSPTPRRCSPGSRRRRSRSSPPIASIIAWRWTPSRPAATCSSRSRSPPTPRRPTTSSGWPAGAAARSAWGTSTGCGPRLAEARGRIESGAIGPLRMVSATLARPWLAEHGGPADAWRYESKITGGGILADVGDHLLDALLWTTGRGGRGGRRDPEPAPLGLRPGDGGRHPHGRRHPGHALACRPSRRAPCWS